jgi:hypothetical protein
MEDISKMTLELLMNKKSYSRYMENTDPSKYQERQDYLAKVRKYKGRILNLTRQYMENPDLQITTEMNLMFAEYTRIFIKYFEMKDLEESCCFEWKKEEDEDILFDPNQMELREPVNDLDDENIYEVNDDASMLGHTDSSKKPAYQYTLDAFMKRK